MIIYLVAEYWSHYPVRICYFHVDHKLTHSFSSFSFSDGSQLGLQRNYDQNMWNMKERKELIVDVTANPSHKEWESVIDKFT